MTSLFKRSKAKLLKVKYKIKRYLIRLGVLYEWKYSFEIGAYREYPVSKVIEEPKKLKPKKLKKERLQKYKVKYNNFRKDYKEKIIEWEGLVIVIISYGVILNYIAYVIMDWTFSWYTFWAYGLLYYLIKEELPRIIQQCKKV